jgi:hypothetical protein
MNADVSSVLQLGNARAYINALLNKLLREPGRLRRTIR